MLQIFRELAIAVLPLAILLPFAVLVEVVSPLEKYSLKSRFPGVIYQALFPAFALFLTYPLTKLWALAGVEPVLDITGLPFAAKFILMLLLFDFLRYWEHRFEHKFWWPVHSVHHSVTKLHAANAYAHPLQAVPEFFFVAVPLSFIDSGGVPIVAAMFIAFQNLIIHSPIRVHAGPLRWAYVDSRFHRLHHSTEPQHKDKNFAIVFSFWDRLFGTAVNPKEEEWPTTGLDGISQPVRLKDYLLHPLRMINSTLLNRPADIEGRQI